MESHVTTCFAFAAMIALSGCAGTGIAIKESMGYAKREQLVDEVQEARDEQQEAKEQFASALDEFLSLPGVDGGELEAKYEQLRDAFEDSEDRADDVRDEIRDVERVGEALFEEWEEEIDEYTSDTLRRSSEDQLRRTRMRYNQLVSAMNRAAEKMDPVIDAFRDQVLFLKHNLNARAIASLEQNLASLESEIAVLIADMERSIAEANAFIEEMEAGG
jgi:Skp family chaperone for outer membrane proteins